MIDGLKPYPEYKDSGVEWLGKVPVGWEVRRLRSSAEPLVNGIWGDEPDGRSDLLCIRVADFDRNRRGVRMVTPTMRSITEVERQHRVLRRGDLLLEKSGGGDQQPAGVVVVYDYDVPAVCSNFVARMRSRSGFDPHFLCYLHSALYAIGLNRRAIKQTTGIQNLDGRAYLNEPVAVPGVAEQSAISGFLDRADGVIRQYIAIKQRLIDLLEEERQGIIDQAVTRGLDPDVRLKPSGVDWLGDVPEHWEIAPLSVRFSVMLGKMLDAKRITGSALVPYLRNADVQWDRITADDLPKMDISGETEMERLSNIIRAFNDQFGNIDWEDRDRVERLITEEIPAAVARDPAYRNAMANSDAQNARIEHDQALGRAMQSVLKDDTQLFKMFSDNPSFSKWLAGVVFNETYRPGGDVEQAELSEPS